MTAKRSIYEAEGIVCEEREFDEVIVLDRHDVPGETPARPHGLAFSHRGVGGASTRGAVPAAPKDRV